MAFELTDVACTACGCVCDDLRITVDADRIVGVAPHCPLAEHWFLSEVNATATAAEIEGRPVPLFEAEQRAVELLRQSRAPFIYGLSGSSTPGQRAAIRLAEQLGALIDTSASTCHGPSILALQQVGESTCTLGEISNRADFVMYWGSNPVESHPRHMSRYAIEPRGLFTPDGEDGRILAVADVTETSTTQCADLVLRVPRGADFDILWALRGLLRGVRPAGNSVSGIPVSELESLLDRMRQARCGIIFFGRGLTAGPTGHCNVQALLLLIRDLNAVTRFHARRMRIYGDVAGADTVLCWQTGFPFSVSLSRGYPRYNPGEFSANELLERGEVDCCLLLGSDGISTLSSAAQQRLSRIPTILLDRPGTRYRERPTVRISTGIYGVHYPGTAYRMDEVPIPLKGFLRSVHPSDASVLDRLTAALTNMPPHDRDITAARSQQPSH